jgi:hypothetical protein
MRTPAIENQQAVAMPVNGEMASVYASQYSYHELADVPVQETDVLQALENNMNQLEEIQSRMKFMMREIRYLMKI